MYKKAKRPFGQCEDNVEEKERKKKKICISLEVRRIALKRSLRSKVYFEFQINCNKSYLNLYASNSTIMGLRVVRRNIIGHSIRIGVGHSQGRGQARQDNSDKCLHYEK